jgi:hypothetical protein
MEVNNQLSAGVDPDLVGMKKNVSCYWILGIQHAANTFTDGSIGVHTWLVTSCRIEHSFCLSNSLSPVWVWNLVSDIKERTQTEGVWEQGAEENM